MRNVWKGLVVGGLIGVTAGVVLDSINRASKKAAELGASVRAHAPDAGRDAGRWVESLTDKAGDWIHDAEVPEHVRDVAHKVKESDTVHRMADAGNNAISAAKEAASRAG